MRNPHTVVIGAGISGLVCAYRLGSRGVDVLLIEKSGSVGGVIQSERIDGYLIERGPNSSQGSDELLALVDETGLGDQLLEGDSKAPAFVYFNGSLHAVPSGPGSFLSSRLLTLGGKLRILTEPFVPRREGEEESVASFARRRIGRQAAERLVAPFVSGIYAGDATRLSVQAAFPRLARLETEYGGLIRGALAKAREARRERKAAARVLEKAAPTRRRLISFRDGMAALPLALAANLGEAMLTRCDNVHIEQVEDGSATGAERWRVRFVHGGLPTAVHCSEVVVATPAFAAADIVRPFSSSLAVHLDEIYYPPVTIACVAYDRPAVQHSLEGFGFLSVPDQGLGILGCVWNSSLFENRAPTNKVLLTVFTGGARTPEIAEMPDDALVRLVHQDLRRVLGIAGQPQLVAITRWKRAIPQYNLGHYNRVREIEETLAGIPGLHLAGNYLHGVSTGDCVRNAELLARTLTPVEIPASPGRT